MPVLAFVHANTGDIPQGKAEMVEINRQKLDSFRAEVMAEYPIRSWSSASELGGIVSRSLVREIKVNPRPGWIRNDGSSPIALLEKINNLTEDNRVLRDKLSVHVDSLPDPSLESGRNEFEIRGTRHVYAPGEGRGRMEWGALVSWDNIFRDIGPALINETTDDNLKLILSRFSYLSELPENYIDHGGSQITLESFNEILIQFRALGFIDQGVKKRGVNDRGSYWRITQAGDRHLVSLLAKRKIDFDLG